MGNDFQKFAEEFARNGLSLYGDCEYAIPFDQISKRKECHDCDCASICFNLRAASDKKQIFKEVILKEVADIRAKPFKITLKGRKTK